MEAGLDPLRGGLCAGEPRRTRTYNQLIKSRREPRPKASEPSAGVRFLPSFRGFLPVAVRLVRIRPPARLYGWL